MSRKEHKTHLMFFGYIFMFFFSKFPINIIQEIPVLFHPPYKIFLWKIPHVILSQIVNRNNTSLGYSIICSTFLRFSSGNNSQPQYQTNRLCWYSKWIPVWIARATAYLSTSQSFVYHSLSAHQTSLLEVYIAKSNQSVNLTRFLLHLEQLISWDSISWFNRFEYLTSIRFFRTCNNLRVFNWGLIIWLCLNERGVGRTYVRWDSSGWKNGKIIGIIIT